MVEVTICHIGIRHQHVQFLGIGFGFGGTMHISLADNLDQRRTRTIIINQTVVFARWMCQLTSIGFEMSVVYPDGFSLPSGSVT